MELGPCRFVSSSLRLPCSHAAEPPHRISPEKEDLVYNPHSWNSNANIFFLDQPAGVGFSFSQAGQPTHRTTEDAAVDVQAFVSLWFETFKEFEGRKFHMSGESVRSFFSFVVWARASRLTWLDLQYGGRSVSPKNLVTSVRLTQDIQLPPCVCLGSRRWQSPRCEPEPDEDQLAERAHREWLDGFAHHVVSRSLLPTTLKPELPSSTVRATSSSNAHRTRAKPPSRPSPPASSSTRRSRCARRWSRPSVAIDL